MPMEKVLLMGLSPVRVRIIAEIKNPQNEVIYIAEMAEEPIPVEDFLPKKEELINIISKIDYDTGFYDRKDHSIQKKNNYLRQRYHSKFFANKQKASKRHKAIYRKNF